MSTPVQSTRLQAASLRPDLPIPLEPAAGVFGRLRSAVVPLRGPRFAEAQRATVFALLAAIGLLSVQFAAVPDLRPWLRTAAVITVAASAVRTVVLVVAERRQRRFEERWLRIQSGALRSAWFEVVRVSIWPPANGFATAWDMIHTDPTRPKDIRTLLDLRSAEHDAGRTSRVIVEFGHRSGAGGGTSVEVVTADLASLIVEASAPRLVHGAVNFPHAEYRGRPERAWGRLWPARRTFWTLGPAVLSTVAPSPTPTTAGLLREQAADGT